MHDKVQLENTNQNAAAAEALILILWDYDLYDILWPTMPMGQLNHVSFP
jgi:hypothetical protein